MAGSCWFRVFLLLVAAAAAVASLAPDVGRAGDELDAVSDWTTRAESLRRQINDKEDAANVDAALAIMYAQQEDADKSLAAAQRVIASGSKAAASELWLVALKVTEHLGVKRANELLRSVHDRRQRDELARYVLMQFGATGDLAAARQTALLIESDEARNDAWIWFAVGASADPVRKFDAAQKAIEDLKPQSEDQRQRIARMKKRIERISQEPPKQLPRPDALWEQARESGDSAHWRRAAIAYLHAGERAKCREGLKKAETADENIEFYSLRVANLTLIAHAYLEMNDPKEAARVVKNALAVLKEAAPAGGESGGELAFDIERVLADALISLALVNVIARTGEFDLAFDVAEASGQWVTLGGGCTSAELQAELRNRLSNAPSSRDRALICIGVVQGVLQADSEQRERDQ